MVRTVGCEVLWLRPLTHAQSPGDSNDIPSILIVISGENGNEDVVVKVSDQGGGIPRSEVDRVWKYLYTTATPAHLPQGEVRDFGTNGPLAGLGYGLPLSRLYARYWGGELQLISMEGYGTIVGVGIVFGWHVCALTRFALQAQMRTYTCG